MRQTTSVALEGRHGFAGANEPLGRVSRTAESSLKEANQISWKRCGEIAVGKPVRAARLFGRKVPFN
jgi:hypothetical protein